MAETPEQLHARAAGALRTPPVEEWDSWPFQGAVSPRPLEPPVAVERRRPGEDGRECFACAKPDQDYLWHNRNWRLFPMQPSGLPLVLMLETREHFDSPGEMPDELAAEAGILISRIDTAMCTNPSIARVHIGRWGEGLAHLHWWFLGRPQGFEQLRSSFAAVWDDVLPPTPEPVWRANVEAFLAAFEPPAG